MKIDTQLALRLEKHEGPINEKTLIEEGKAFSGLGWRILSHIPFAKNFAEHHFLKKSQAVLSFLNEQVQARMQGAQRVVVQHTVPKNYHVTDRIFFLQPLIQSVGPQPELLQVNKRVLDHRAFATLTNSLSEQELEPIIAAFAKLSDTDLNRCIAKIQLEPKEKLTVEHIEKALISKVAKKKEQPPSEWKKIQNIVQENPCAFFVPTLPSVLQAISPDCAEVDLERLPDALTAISPLFKELKLVQEIIQNLEGLENQPDSKLLLDILHGSKAPEELTTTLLSLLDTRIAEAKTGNNWISQGAKRIQEEVQKAHDLCQNYKAYQKSPEYKSLHALREPLRKLEFAKTQNEWDPLVLYLFVNLEEPATQVDRLLYALNMPGLGFLMKAAASKVVGQLQGLLTSYIGDALKYFTKSAMRSQSKADVTLDSQTQDHIQLLARLFTNITPLITKDLDAIKPVLEYMSYLNKSIHQESDINDTEFEQKTIAMFEAMSKLMKTNFRDALVTGIEQAPKAMQ